MGKSAVMVSIEWRVGGSGENMSFLRFQVTVI